MTRDELIEAALQCGAWIPIASCPEREQTIDRLQRLVGRAAAAEREACAKVCNAIAEDRWKLYKGRAPYTGGEDGRAHPQTQGESDGADMCASAIRARGDT